MQDPTSVQLIRNSGNCKDGDKVAKSVLQAAIGSVSAIAAMAPGAGLAGIAISLGGKILSAITDRFFDENTPKKMIAVIEEEERSEDLNCLYYMLQKEALGCDKELFKSAGLKLDPAIVCGQNYTGNHELVKKVSSDIRNILDRASENTSRSRQQSLYNIVKSMNLLINDPVTNSKDIPFNQYLKNIAQDLEGTTDFESKKLAGSLNSFLENYSKLETKLKAKGDEAAKSKDLSSEELRLMESLDQLKSDGIERAIQKYWEAKGKGDTLSKLQGYERLVTDVEAGNRVSLELANSINNVIANANSQRKIDVAHSAFVNSFQKKNEERLKKLNTVWNKNRGLQDTDDSTKDMIPLLQLCTLNAGLAFFGISDFETKGRNLVSKEIPAEYRAACEQFNCELPLFDPKKHDSTNRAREFKKYQCSMYIRYPNIMSNLADNMKKTGKPCK